MINMLKNLHQEDSGQDLIEYGLIALIVGLGVLTGMGKLSKSINSLFSNIRRRTHLALLFTVPELCCDKKLELVAEASTILPCQRS